MKGVLKMANDSNIPVQGSSPLSNVQQTQPPAVSTTQTRGVNPLTNVQTSQPTPVKLVMTESADSFKV